VRVLGRRYDLGCLLTGLMAVGCGSPAGPSPSPTGALVGAGDIADCVSPGAALTARLLDRFGGTVFTTGDNAYPTGSAESFRDCYHPTWGRHLRRTHPVPGNHDYQTPGAAAYYAYFGNQAGPAGLGYYSYYEGPWRVIALNSEIPVHPGSPQMDWLEAELRRERRRCTLAYWHRPLFSSGPNGNHHEMRDLWQTLYDANADVILVGHDHLYERFGPQDADGRPDQTRGLRQFTVGTGGGFLYEFRTVRPNSEVRITTWGVLSLSLLDGMYLWEFVSAENAVVLDSGSATCH
jgi:acid phosphatase type 7